MKIERIEGLLVAFVSDDRDRLTCNCFNSPDTFIGGYIIKLTRLFLNNIRIIKKYYVLALAKEVSSNCEFSS